LSFYVLGKSAFPTVPSPVPFLLFLVFMEIQNSENTKE